MACHIIKNIITKKLSFGNPFASGESRALSTAALEATQHSDKMLSWQIHSYGGLEELQLSQQTRVPYITKPSEVLIKIDAVSVNPLDILMIGGYASKALNFMRTNDNVEFPLTLCRDFCGTVVSKGLGSGNNIPVGTAVWGVVPVELQGCLAEYVVVEREMIAEKPTNLNTHEAASMLYAGLTAWSGLTQSANLTPNNMKGKKAIVLGASGGVGSAAVQMLHAGGAHVSATCSANAFPLVESLRAFPVLDYSAADHDKQLVDNGPYDLILDCAGLGSEYATSKLWEFKNYVTFSSPVMNNFDKLGIFRGAFANASDLICPNIQGLKRGRSVRWGFFIPSMDGIKYITDLVESNKLKPIVEKVYKFSESPEAFKKVADGHMRGKIVIDIKGKSS